MLLGPAEQQEWKKVSGRFSTVIACPLTCRSQQAPQGISPWAHQANGCTDLILVRQCSKINLIKWFLRQKRTTQVRREGGESYGCFIFNIVGATLCRNSQSERI